MPSVPKVILLPGLDGTGELFADFVVEVGDRLSTAVVQYPRDRFFSYRELEDIVKSATSAVEPFVLVSESFSSPLAIQYAATKPPNLKGLVICAGFASNPLRGLLRIACPLLLPFLFSVSPPAFALRLLLVGVDAPTTLVENLQTVISSVKRTVLRSRLQAVLACDVKLALSKVDVPVLYVQAARDRLVNTAALAEIREIKPDATIASVVGPHLLLQREPQKSAEVILRFVQHTL